MLLALKPVLSFASFASVVFAQSTTSTTGNAPASDVATVCKKIQSSITSASAVFYPGSSQFTADIKHYSLASIEQSKCSVEPGSVQDVATVLKILGSTKTQFAIKGGGHSFNRGYSSTTGVHIAMTRLKSIKFDKANMAVDIGAGAVWDDVYNALDPLGINVIGGRVTGVGVAGYTLGGGYSWLSNQHGLLIDNVLAFDLITPKGDQLHVTSTSNSDLFFALKGGWNNFGIVTNFRMKAFKQGPVTGGTIIYGEDQIPAYRDALAKYSKVSKDPKAQIYAPMGYSGGQIFGSLAMFYDGPVVPPGVYDDFFAIPSLFNDVKNRTFLDFFNSLTAQIVQGIRQTDNTVSLLFVSDTLIDQMFNQTRFWVQNGADHKLETLFFIPEPFLETYFQNATSSAYPHDKSLPLEPVTIAFGWEADAAEEDEFWVDAVKSSVDVLYRQAVAEGQDVSIERGHQIRYGNYAVTGTPLELIWGKNIPRLRSIKKVIDPTNVMGLTGGWKL